MIPLHKLKKQKKAGQGGQPFAVVKPDGNFAAVTNVSKGLSAESSAASSAAAASAAATTDEDTVIGEEIGECGWVIKEASDYIRGHRVGDFRDAFGVMSEGIYQQAVELAEKAALCHAYLKGIRISLAADVSEEYLNHLIEVAESIRKSHETKFVEEPLVCLSPDDYRPYGGFDTPEEYYKRTGIVMKPSCLTGYKRVVDLPSKPSRTAVAMAVYKHGSDALHPYEPKYPDPVSPEDPSDADCAVAEDGAGKTLRDRTGKLVARGKKRGNKTQYRDRRGRLIVTCTEDDAEVFKRIKTKVEAAKAAKK